MELSLENLEQSSGQDLWSSKGDDSNAIILPEKKGKKRKGMKQEHEKFKTNKTRKLSASQKRKLKKLEEEKEKSLLLSKSIETLEKYKIREDAFSLLQSSQNLGQVETTLEKRRRAVRFSKAGLEMPHSDRPFKSQDGEMEPDSNKIQSKQEFDESDAITELAVNSRHSPTLPAKEVSEKNYDTSMQDRRNSTPTSTTADGQKNIKGTSNLPDCSLQPITTPTVVHVSRPTEVENNRKDLPIVMMEQEIMEAINDHTAVIICGETGCGKTTQVPQFLYEAGFGSKQASVQSGIIGVTQPRRVAVLATAKRVAFELGLSLGKEVGFQVRHDKMIGDSCSIKFMTDGILLREVQNDFSLRRYSVIILDEAHERSLNTDILIGMLSRVIQVRQKLYEEQQQMMLSGVRISPESMVPQLKLVLMSATLRVEDFISGRRLFHTPPPVIEVPSRQFPVTIHFSKRTEIVDYIGQAYKKILSIHKKLPQGGILVFLMLNKEINEAFEIQGNSANQQTDRFSIYDEDHGDLDEDDSDSSYDSETEKDRKNDLSAGALCVLPLYAMLPAAAQLRVFEEIKEGERLVVVATNVAETSLTIPGIKYVVDTGREKVKNYDHSNGMETYEVQWISKASAAQRAGRAGRTGPGHCYRLYSSAVFNNILPDFSMAEILKVPVEGVILLMKSMDIDKVANFPFPTPPDAIALAEAERCLKALEALNSKGRLTPLGKAMAHYPMSPRHSRMLLTVIQIMRKAKGYARANLVLGYAVAAAAALSLPNPFVMQFEGNHTRNDGLDQKKKLKETAKVSRAKFSNPSSDALTVAYALQCFELSGSPVEFCNENVMHLKTLEEMSKLRKQLLQLVFNQSTIAISGSSEGDRKAKAARYQACMVKETVFLHRWSSLARSAPEFLVYSELLQTKRPYMHGVTNVKPDWLVKYAAPLCSFSAPLTDPKPYYEPLADQVFCWVIPTFGPHLWRLPLHGVPISDNAQRVSVFAYALLEGQVLPCLGSVRKYMAAPPASILRPEALGQRRVGNLLSKLKSRPKTIDSCLMLREAWRENPRELHSEILDWFQETFHKQFEVLWSQMHLEVLLDPQERFPKKKRGKRKK
ncbi:unnamed protein product, partial [Vitis vinifera]